MGGVLKCSIAVYFVCCLFGMTAQAANQAIVAKRTIYPGQTIERTDLKAVVLVRKPLIRYRFVQNFDEVTGMTAAKTILPGRFIPLNAAKASMLIKAGSKIRIQLNSGSLNITVTAVALSDGGAGDEVKFRNPTSGKVFFGFVRADGTVEATSL